MNALRVYLYGSNGPVEAGSGSLLFPDQGGGDPTDPGEEPGETITLLGAASTSDSYDTHPPTGPVTQGDWYVDPNASTNGDGSEGSPFNTLRAALDNPGLVDGDTILVKKGTLHPTDWYQRTTHWPNGINVFNYGYDRPVVDASNNRQGNDHERVLSLQGSREHWKGFEIKNAGPNGEAVAIDGYNSSMNGHHYTLEDIWVHDCQTNSFWLQNGPYDNIFIDCVAWKAGDGLTTNYTNAADHFGTSGFSKRTTLVRCVGINAPDDNFDSFRGSDNLIIDPVSIASGYYWNGLCASSNSGDGKGYKLGGDDGASGNTTVRGGVNYGSQSHGVSYHGSEGHSIANMTSVKTGLLADGYDQAAAFSVGADDTVATVENSIGWQVNEGALLCHPNAGRGSNNNWNLSNGPDPVFADPGANDYSLAQQSPCIGTGTDGGNLGASDVALKLLKKWLTKIDDGEIEAYAG